MDKQSTLYRYWNRSSAESQKLTGVYPIGGGGEFEIKYRHFFESKNLKKRIDFSPDQVVLEFGCGNGRWAYELAPLVNHYVGVDFNFNAIEYCRETSKAKKISNVEFHHSSIEEFRWEHTAKIDVIYFSGVSQYLTDHALARLLAKYQDVLSEKCVVIERSSINLKQRVIRNDPEYFSIYRTPHEILAIFEYADWKNTDSFDSYVFLRNAFLLGNNRINTIAGNLSPFSFYFFLALSKITNLLTGRALDRHVEPYDGKHFAHKFYLFKRAAGATDASCME